MDDTYSLRDLVEVTGAKPRSLQLWADRKVIHAVADTDDAGSGVHRRFSRDEAIIACMVHAFALRQISIGELKVIAQIFRSALRIPRTRAKVIDAVQGKGDTFFTYQWAGGEDAKESMLSFNISDEEITSRAFKFLKEPESMMMAIRLETYLSKLK
jgi:hypothetical protein